MDELHWLKLEKNKHQDEIVSDNAFDDIRENSTGGSYIAGGVLLRAFVTCCC